MEKQHTQKGFAVHRFRDARGIDCSVQRSSNTTEPRIWLGTNEILSIKHIPGKGWELGGVPEEADSNARRMELNQEQAERLLPILERFVKTGDI